MADVFLAVARGPGAFNKLVVVKCLRGGMPDHQRYVLMFLDEAKLAARLNHANVVQTYEIGEENGNYFIVMEYLEGQPLKEIIRAVSSRGHGSAGVSRGAWVRIMVEVLRGLHYAHELCDFDGSLLGIVHRDVSPHNIFVTYEGAVKLVDFGVAKAALNSARTESGAFKGKMAYAAPEQVAASHSVDRRADIFAVGIVLWELMTQRRLFDGDHVSVMHQLLMREIPRLTTIVPDIDPALDEIVAKALERDPERRFSTAQEMLDALEGYLVTSGEDVRAEQLGARVLEMFAESRALVRQQINAQIEHMAASEPPLDFGRPSIVSGINRVPLASLSGSSLPVLSEHGGSRRPSSTSAQPAPVVADSGDSKSLRERAPWFRQRNIMFGALGLAALAILGAGAIYVRNAPAPQPPPPPPASVSEVTVPNATVSIKSVPSEAVVSWRGTVLGKTPLDVKLPSGTQVLVVSRAGCFDETLVLQLTPSDVIERVVSLRRQDFAATPSSKTGTGAP